MINYGINPYRLYEKFLHDYQNDTNIKDESDINKKLERELKTKRILQQYEKKLFPKSKAWLISDRLERVGSHN